MLVFSVGGGNVEKKVSANIVAAPRRRQARGALVFGIVGRDGGYTAQLADACVVIPPTFARRTSPPTPRGCAAVIWHLLVTHPALAGAATKWESVG